jgi:predicted Fe-Mo cluster-binding NifX family protein/predicted DNA-binding protein (UPF0251 family)
MARPFKCRRIGFSPQATYFKPAGIPLRELDEVVITLDEVEALRLAHLESLYQEQAAEKMNISRQTFGNILNAAYRKITDGIVNAKAIKIEGGVCHPQDPDKKTSHAKGLFMKVAVSSTGKELNSKIDTHLGRCAYFVIADIETMQTEVYENQSAALAMGAGIEAARFLVSKGVGTVITGVCGPKAEQVFQAAGIQILQGQGGTVLSAIEKLKNSQSVKAVSEEILMKFAIPTENGKLTAHFGHCREFALVDVENNKIKKTEMLVPPPHEPGVLPKWLGQLKVNVVIAGGMGPRAVELLNEQDIKVILGAPIESPETLVMSYLNKTLDGGKNLCEGGDHHQCGGH